MKEESIKIQVEKDELIVILEPVGMVYQLKKGQIIEIVIYGETDIEHEKVVTEEHIAIYINSSSAYKTYIDSEYYDGYDVPFPTLPISSKEFINMTFGGPGKPGLQENLAPPKKWWQFWK